jgi:hypothetical protein
MAAASRDLTIEVAELRAENQRLRGLLGLDSRTADGHLDAWSPTLLASTPTTSVLVTDNDPVEAKIAMLRRLIVRGSLGRVCAAMVERVVREVGVVTGYQRRLVEAALAAGLPGVDRRRAGPALAR